MVLPQGHKLHNTHSTLCSRSFIVRGLASALQHLVLWDSHVSPPVVSTARHHLTCQHNPVLVLSFSKKNVQIFPRKLAAAKPVFRILMDHV